MHSKKKLPEQGVTTRQAGEAAETAALAHLQRAGLRLVVRNYRTPGRGGGEVDLILRDRDGTLVFVEVRQRSHSGWGGAAASVGWTKRRRLVRAAQHFLLRLGSPPPCRFDVVAVDEHGLQWLQAAFDAS